ncbi:uncharacterized protein Dwil_GK23740 [Drosophila willistoni]|uniref:Uncharacterized protein n=1 Tax=Drosophila willistoni TaxID=7260 RepID=A0A0Q9X234_DROWI|nr:uncharacterized protein LOC6641599 [Drosophila willistoni]KRF98279.1 uncharacterized protein Dwil_GK23740 [Drosophila willistoni]
MKCCGIKPETCCACQEPSGQDGLKFKKEPQPVILDALGLYPDEFLMTVLDRVLYYSGATKIKHMFQMATLAGGNVDAIAAAVSGVGGETLTPARTASSTSCAKATSKCSIVSLLCPPPKSGCSSIKPALIPCISCSKSKPPTPVRSSVKPTCLKSSSKCLKPSPTCCSRLSAASCCPRQRSPRVDFANAVPDCRQSERQESGGLSMRDRLKYSLSLCSMACRNLKSKLPCSCRRCTTKESDRNKWLWTRLISTKDGCKVYEVYKDSNVNRAPCNMEGSKEPVIIFLIMPNGYIMPFETFSF